MDKPITTSGVDPRYALTDDEFANACRGVRDLIEQGIIEPATMEPDRFKPERYGLPPNIGSDK